jgi:hypothetical protein
MTNEGSDAPEQFASPLATYDEWIDFVLRHAGPEAVLAFQPSDAAQNRVYELIHRERDGVLTEGEAEELKSCVTLNHILQRARIRARRLSRP